MMRKLTHQPLSRLTLAVFGAVLASSGIAVHASEITDASFPELLPDTEWTLLSSIEDQYPTDASWTPDCTDPTKCAKYTGVESDMIKNVDSPISGGSDYDNSLSPFYDGSGVGNHEGKTLLVSSLKDVQGFIYGYSNTNGYRDDSYMPSAVAKNNTLVIDLGNFDGPAHAIRGATTFNIGSVASVAAAGNARGGAVGNQMLMRNSSISVEKIEGFGDSRPGWHMAAASVAALENDSSDNVTILDHVKIAMDPSKPETERNFVRVGALYAYLVNEDVTLKNNRLWVIDSEVDADSLYGFALYGGSGFSTAEANSVYVARSDLWFNPTSTGNSTAGVYAAYGVDHAVGNWVEVSDSDIQIIKHASSTSAFKISGADVAHEAERNVLIVRDTNIASEQNLTLAGGYCNQNTAGNFSNENAVFVGGTDSVMSITGAGATTVQGGVAYMKTADQAVETKNNSVSLTNLSAGKLSVYGGYIWAASGVETNMRAESNDVVLSNVEANSLQLFGGRITGGDVVGNRSYMTGLKLHGDANRASVLIGGQSNVAGIASDNHLYIEDSQIGSNVQLYGGFVGAEGADAAAKDNLVVIGSNVTGIDGGALSFVSVYGGGVNKVGFNDGNRLVTGSRFQTGQLGGFQHYEFAVSQERLDEGAFITVTGAVPVTIETSGTNASTVGIGLTGEEEIAPGSYTLINSAAGFAHLDGTAIAGGTSLDDLKTTVTTTTMPSIVRIQTTALETDDYDLAIDNAGKDLVMTIKNSGSSWSEVNPETDALMESSLSAYGTLFAADDLFVDTVLRSRNGGHDGFFAAARTGKWDLDSRGDTDSTIVSGLMGYAARSGQTEFGGFVEMGHATYDVATRTDLAKASGDGKHNYAGVGVYVNQSLPVEGWKVTGYVKGGAFSNRYDAQLAGATTELDRTRAYWGAHLGTHFDYRVSKLRGRAFLSYFYDGMDSMSFNVKGQGGTEGARFEYDALNAHRVQLGSLFEYDYSPTHRPYFGLAIEQTVSAEAKGEGRDSQGELSLRSTDLEGTTGILSAGWTYAGEEGFSFEFGLNGYAGARNGVSGQIQANWKF